MIFILPALLAKCEFSPISHAFPHLRQARCRDVSLVRLAVRKLLTKVRLRRRPVLFPTIIQS